MNDNVIPFRRLQLSDKALVLRYTLGTACRNCDLSFMNLCSWQFRYQTEVAEWHGRLLFRFFADGHLAYLFPLGEGPLRPVLEALRADSRRAGHPFLLLGVCEGQLPLLEEALPGYFRFSYDRDYSDYVYDRSALATLQGRKLQAKRNFVNRFYRLYPTAHYRELTPADIPLCEAFEQYWLEHKQGYADDPLYAEERRSMRFVFSHWDSLDGRGGLLFVDDRLVAFTYGAAIGSDTFDICFEKADVAYEGAYAVINKCFASSLPERYVYVNREEDLGVGGLRRAKESYQPAILLHKYAAMARCPMEEEHGRERA